MDGVRTLSSDSTQNGKDFEFDLVSQSYSKVCTTSTKNFYHKVKYLRTQRKIIFVRGISKYICEEKSWAKVRPTSSVSAQVIRVLIFGSGLSGLGSK